MILRRLRSLFRGSGEETAERLRNKLVTFRDLVEKNDRVLELIADAGEKLGGEYVFDRKYLDDLTRDLRSAAHSVVEDLNVLTGNAYPRLRQVLSTIDERVEAALECRTPVPDAPWILPLSEVGIEHAEMVGEKVARLGEISRRLGCEIPTGFVVTTGACQHFLETVGLGTAADALRSRAGDDQAAVEEAAQELHERILAARVPRDLERSIRKAVDHVVSRDPEALFAVRSSAAEEDGTLTFAGQYDTVLGVSPDQVVEAYREVVASLFSPSVIRYQREHDVPPGCGLMAVGCLSLVRARASGVAYTLNPAAPEARAELITSTWGLGKAVVEGEAPVDRFEVRREPGYPVTDTVIADKSWRYVAHADRGLVREPVPERQRRLASLDEATVSRLAEEACRIERYMKAAQDIEWAVDEENRLFILQARPLSIPAGRSGPPDLTGIEDRHPVLLRDRGEVVCRGIGIGPVHIVDPEASVDRVPPGAVLVARQANARLGGVLGGVSAVVTDLGSATGHFAAVVRDFRVPTLVATGDATATLEEGVEVTVDAEQNVVYEGRVDRLLRSHLLKRASFEDTREFRLLRRILHRIAPLTLRDPQSPDFTADRCRTYHDVIRFAHEKAIAALIDIGWVRAGAGQRNVRRLELPIPLDLILIDIDGGYDHAEDRDTARLTDIRSRPLRPLLEALTAEGIWETAPADMDMDGFMSSATRSAALTGPLAARPEQNLAIVSEEYLHLSLRLGYHFNIVDAHFGTSPADNHIYFRFAGGATELTRRSRRASLLKQILASHGFVTEGREDLVIGRIKGLGPDAMVESMRMLGRLIGFTRQLDVFLRSDSLVTRYMDRFLGRPPEPTEGQEPESATERLMSSIADVMVLDDEQVVCDRLQEHLGSKGYDIEVYTESQAAVDRLAEKRFDVVITDLKMAGPSGLDVLRFVRDQHRGTQVIIITGYGSFEAARKAQYTGAYEFVSKPFSMKSLETLTRKAASKARKLEEKGVT